MSIDEVLSLLSGPGPWVGFCLGLGARSLVAGALRAFAVRLRLRAKATPDPIDDALADADARALEIIAKGVTVIPLSKKRPLGGDQ